MIDTTFSQRPQRVALGIGLIIATGFVISTQDVVFKLFSSTLSLWQIFTLRALLAMPLLFALALWRKEQRTSLQDAMQFWPLMRSACLTMTFMLFYAAIAFLDLSTVGAANYIAPIFVTLLSAYFIGEAVSLRGWCAVILGFTGVLVLLQPGTDAFSFWAILPVIGALFYAFTHLITRSKCHDTSVTTLALSVNIVMLIAGVVMSGLVILWQPAPDLVQSYPNVLSGWSALDAIDWMVLGVLACFVVVLGMMLAAAYQVAPPATVATFEYSYLIFVALWDLLFFASPPSAMTLMGMVLIIGAGLLVLRR